MNRFSIEKMPSEVQIELANRFKSLRRQKKMSQAALAEKSGVSLGSLKRFEQTGQISLESLLILSHFFDRLTDFDTLFKTDENWSAIEKLFCQKNNLNCPTAQKNTFTYLFYFDNQTLILMNFTEIFRHITYF
jgi:transcriptional regulator with XRE-family HTH domain